MTPAIPLPDPQAPRPRPLTEDLASVFLATTGTAFLLPYVAGGMADAPAQAMLYAFAPILFIIAIGLLRLRPWARRTAFACCTSGAVVALIEGLSTEFTLLHGIALCFATWWAVGLWLPAARRLFSGEWRGFLPRTVFWSQLISWTFTVTAVAGMSRLPLPGWLVAPCTFVLLAFYRVRLSRQVARWTAWVGAERPANFDASLWPAFREAWRCRLAGNPTGARALLSAMPPHPAVEVLHGLLEMESAARQNGLARTVFDAAFQPDAAGRALVARELQDTHAPLLAERRARWLDLLVEDALSDHPLFLADLVPAAEQLTGRSWFVHDQEGVTHDWPRARPFCTGDQAATWLTARFWHGECVDAAEEIARLTSDPRLQRLARLNAAIGELASGKADPRRVASRLDAHLLLLQLSDATGLLRVDSPGMKAIGLAVAAEVVRSRLTLVERVLELEDRYPVELETPAMVLLSQLVAAPVRVLRLRHRFLSWWMVQREPLARFDQAMARGLAAAAEEMWSTAIESFRAAAQERPEFLCPAYNQAYGQLRSEHPADAERILAVLVSRHPGEAAVRAALGDARRALGRTDAALEAYREAAARVEGSRDMSLRIGVALAAAGEDAEAESVISRALGEFPDSGDLEELAVELENAGAFSLARRYRERAFGRSLEEDPNPDRDHPDTDPQGSTG